MRVAMGQFAPGITDSDNGTIREGLGAKSLAFQGRASQPAIEVGRIEPVTAAIASFLRGHLGATLQGGDVLLNDRAE